MATKKILTHLDLKGKIDATGTVLGSNLSGTNTGDQDLSGYLLNTTDTLTGNLTVTGTTTVGGKTTLNDNLQLRSISTVQDGTVVKGGFLNPAAEASMVHIPHLINDLAGFNKWGTVTTSGLYKTRSGTSGSYTYTSPVTTSDFNSGAAFDAYSSTAGSWYSDNGLDGTTAGVGVITLEWTNEITYSCWSGIVFGSGSFTPKRVKIEAFRAGAWQTLCDITNNSDNVVLRQIGNNSGTGSGTTKLRYTLGGSVNGSYFRIHTLYMANYRSGDNNLANVGSDVTRGLNFLEKYKDVFLHGNFRPGANTTYDLGSSTYQWRNAYIDGFIDMGTNQFSDTNVGNWNTAFGWGDHGLSSQDKIDIGNLSGTNTGDQDLSGYLLNTTDTFTGSLTINGDIRGAGQQLVLNAGESYNYPTGQTSENVYVNAEAGLQVNSSPDNWTTGWSGRNVAYINRADATSYLPGLLTVAGNVSATGTVTGSNLSGTNNGDQTAAEILTAIKTVDGSGSGLDADLLDGLQLGTGRNNSANQVVRTQGNGYIDAGWINTTSGNTGNTITDIYVNTNDGYIRKATQAHFRSQVTDGSYPTKTGSGASGTWGINISGTATNATSSGTSSQLEAANTGNLNTTANSVTAGELIHNAFSGSAANKPPTSDNANSVITVGQHSGNYNAQLAFSSDGNMYWRDNPSTSFGSWDKIWDSSNLTNVSQLTNNANYVTSSGNTIIGTDSDINTSGNIVVDQLNMTDGVITSHSTRTLTLGNLGYTGAINANYITNNNQLTNGASYITDGNTNWNNTYGFVTSSGNTIIGTDSDINTSGATIIDNLYMTDGVITSHGTRVLTLGNLGFTGAANANYITNNNQITNGAGYISSFTNTTYTAGNGLSLSGTQFRMAGGSIGSSVNLNTYTNSGYYVQGSNASATSGTNWPTNNAGILTVVRAEGNTTHITQTYDQYNSNAFYNRSYYGGTWSSWRNLAQDTNTTYSSSSFTHNSLSGVIANEHLDWTTDRGATNIHANNYTNTNTQLSTEQVQDIVGAMVSGNTENNITVTYQDGDGTLDFSSVDTNTNTQRTDEQIRDVASAQWINGTNTTVVKDDSANTIKINSVDNNTQLSDANIAAMGYIKTQSDTQDLSISGHTISLTNGGSVTVPDNNTQLSDANIAAMGYIKTQSDTQNLSISGHTISLTNGGSVTVPDNNTFRGIHDTPVNGATTTSISSNWAFDNVKTAVPSGALFTDTDTNTVYVHPNYATTNINTSGSTIIDSITTNSTGHITGMGTRVLNLGNLGFTGDTNANHITNNNQLTNGASYLTSTNDRVYITDSRGSARLPSYYDDRYSQWDFQNSSDTGAGGDSWHSILTTSKWSSYNSSHRQEQLIFTGNDLKRRTASSDSAWGSVKTIYDSGNLTLGTLGYTGATNANYITDNDQLLNGAGYTNDQTAAEIRTKIASSPLTATHLAAGSVGASEIGNDVVNSQHYAAGSIDNEHIADNAINSEHYADGSIDNAHIADNAINSEHYADGSIDRAHLSANIIDGTKLDYDSVNSQHYVDNSIDALHLNVSGNGTTSQYLRSDGDGTMTWATPTDTNTDTVYTHPGYSSTNINTSGATIVDVITTNSTGHVTALGTRTLTLANLGYTGSATANNYTHPGYATTNINTSGATIVDSITTNSTGHITAMGTRTLTLANLGYTGATNANNITNNNQLTNGVGYLTSSSTQSKYLRSDVTDGTTGSLGVGKTNPSLKLDIKSGTNNGIRISATDTTSNWRDISIRSYTSEAQADALPSGSHIFTTNPASATETAFSKYGGLVIQGRDDGNSSFAIRLGNGGGYATRMHMDGVGVTTFSNTVTATNFILSSDKRLKENIKKVDNKHIDVDWKTFEMKSDEGQSRYGVIAQELEEVHPEFVRTDEQGMKSVAYIDLLIAKIAELEARLDKLEK